MKLADLLVALPRHAGQISEDLAGIEVTAITPDSRQVRPGWLFVAYRGVDVDGHTYIPNAIEQGAVAIVCEESPFLGDFPAEGQSLPIITVPNAREALAHLSAAWYGFPSRQILTVGITGTDGKTTTTSFLYQILHAAGRKVGMISTVGAIIGEEVLETGLHTTTPDAPDVQRFLAQMVAAGMEVCLLETTSHGLAQHRVAACDFDVAIVTNITHEHLDIHGSLDAYRTAKAMLFESLATAADKGLPKTAVLNCDDWSFKYLKARLAADGTPWLGYSLDDHLASTVTACDVTLSPAQTRFTVRGRGYRFEAETVLLGDYNISNALAAVTAAVEIFGLSPAAAQQGIAALPGVPGRMERIDEGQTFTAVVDFAHTPNSLRRALSTAQQLTQGRVIAVFGCAGLRDVDKRTIMGKIAAELAHVTIITAEDPRTEDLDAIIDQTAQAMLAQGAVEGYSFHRVPDRGQAIFQATKMAQADDMVLVLGKGHEQSMCFGQIEYPWDDREAVRSALRGQPLLTLPSAS